MAEPRFRVWFGDRAASVEELRRIEDVEVTQEMDAFWEARLRVSICLDDKGAWRHWPGEDSEVFSRVRVEVDPGDGEFTPLIDGPLAAIDAGMDAQPGRSTATMVVLDDSAFLHTDEDVEAPFENKAASEIASDLFSRFSQIQSTRVEQTNDKPEMTTRRGTVLQFLRRLAAANNRHAYVLPGATRGSSIGCFLPDPEGAADLPPLVLVGSRRNLSNASVAQDPMGGERTRAFGVRRDDQSETSFETSAADLGLMRDMPAMRADLTPRRLLHPGDNVGEDPEAAATARARRRGYVYKLTSHVVPGCYQTVLTPYQKVRLDAGAMPYSGDYLITRVIHRITPSTYTQELEARADSVSNVSGTSNLIPAGVF